MLLIERVVRKIKKEFSCKSFASKVQCASKPVIYAPVTVLAKDVVAGKGLTVYPGAYFWGNGPIRIGDNVAIGKDSIFFACKEGGIFIGNDVSIAAQCYVIDSDHGLSPDCLMREQPMVSAAITIEDDVWVGAGVKVLKGVTLHKGCVCAAGAVITKDVPEYAIAGGVPAKVIGRRG